MYPRLSRGQPAESTNVWLGKVTRRVYLGDFVQYFVEWAGGTLSVRQLPTGLFEEGDALFIEVDPERCVFVE